MLADKIQPILERIRTSTGTESQKYELSHSWFQEHQENFVENTTEMSYLCELPSAQRKLLTYPVIGNWYLDKITNNFHPKNESETYIAELFKTVVSLTRFHNEHMKEWATDRFSYNASKDDLNSALLTEPKAALTLHNILNQAHSEICDMTNGKPHKPTYTTDLGHGLASPSSHYNFLTWHIEMAIENEKVKPLDVSIMVVDDEMAKEWYERMISVGFKHVEGQQGYFSDCESALAALEREKYDVILTDLELGEGKMGGIEFVKNAYELQVKREIVPMISCFSFNKQKLHEADQILRGYRPSEYDIRKVFHQVNMNNKSRFTAMGFRTEVQTSLESSL